LEEKMSEQRELRPCPFCGSLAESALYQDDRWIECPRCQQGISGDADCITAEALIDIWNTRPIEDALQARIAELELILAADKLIEDGWIGRIEAGDKRIAELEAENALQARIEELEAKLDAYAEREQWHPFIVNKNEPNESGYYLTVQRVGKFATIILTEHWVASPGFWDTKAIVTHWRELPAPPDEQ
jgi:hypothetical protein